MATLNYIVGRPDYDWEVLLQNLLANGAFTTTGSSGSTLVLEFDGVTLTLTGANLEASAGRTIISGSIDGFTLTDNGQDILSMSGLTTPDFEDVQAMLDGAGALDPYSEDFKDLFAPLFTAEAVTATGSDDGDSIFGSAGSDDIDGGDGSDYIRGGDGVDTLAGGDGDDDFLDYLFDVRSVGINLDLATNTVVDNDVGAAIVDNISGFEDVAGTQFDDVIRGGDGRNAFFGNGGNDTLEGRGGDNFYVGGEGDDTFIGGDFGGDGQWDKVSYLHNDGTLGVTVTFNGAGSITVVDTYGDTDTGTGIEGVQGSMFADVFNGSEDGEQAEGMAGNDVFDMGGGRDEVDYEAEIGAGGTHGVVVNLSDEEITSSGDVGAHVVAAGHARDAFGDDDTLIDVENIGGTNYADYIVGPDTDLYSGLSGRGGNDILIGGSGNNYINGGEGDDILAGGDGDNFYEGGEGTDTYIGGTGTNDGDWDKISYEWEEGGSGIVAVFNGDGSVSVTDTYGNAETGTGIDEIKGSQYDDLFTGSSGNDNAEGMGGADTFNLGDGRDQVVYQNERDAGTTQGVIVNLSDSEIVADVGNGDETVQGGTARDSFGNTDILNDVEDIRGTAFADYIVGNGEDNELKGSDGSDVLIGGEGNDNLRGDEGGDDNQGDDFLFGNDGEDSFKGGAGNDYIDGGADRDRVEYNLETTFTGDDATHGVIVNLSDTALTGIILSGFAGEQAVAAGTALDTRGYIDTLVDIEDIWATGYNDYVVGNDDRNDVDADEGDDIVYGGGGNDELHGGDGSDSLHGEDGNDGLDGGAGDDYLEGGAGDNYFEGFEGDDTLVGGTGTGDGEFDKAAYSRETGGSGIVAVFHGGGAVTVTDTYGDTDTGTSIEKIKGSNYSDTFTGSADDDRVEGYDGDDVFNLGAGRDEVDYRNEGDDSGNDLGVIVNLSASAITVDVGNGDETVQSMRARDAFGATDTLSGVEVVVGTSFGDYLVGGAEENRLEGGDGSDTLRGGAGDDVLRGDEGGDDNQGDDQLFGEAGNDSFKGGDGADHFDGGADTDTVEYNLETTFTGDTATHGVKINLGSVAFNDPLISVTGIPDGPVAASSGVDTRNNVDTFVSIENIRATDYQDLVIGSAADNFLIGLGGDDYLSGGAGGNDTLEGGEGNDILAAWSGADDFIGGDGSDAIVLYGWAGGATLDLRLSNQVLGGSTVFIASVENAAGGGGSDTLTGTDGDNTLMGGWNQFATTSDGNDTLNGLGGNDTFMAITGNDTFNGGNGSDWVSFAAFTAGVTIDLDLTGAQAVTGGSVKLSSIENVIGGSGNDTLRGTDGANALNGGDGNDTFLAWSGADVFNGQDGSDTVSFAGWGSSVNINLDLTGAQAGAGGITVLDIENVQGGNGHDTLRGNGGANTLKGGAGNDTFQAWIGADVFDGEGGTGDTVTFAGWSTAVTLNLELTGAQAGAGDVTVLNIENVIGGNGDDTLRGSNGANNLRGGNGDDTFQAWVGADTFIGEGGADDTVTFAGWNLGVTLNLELSGAQAGAGGITVSGIENAQGGNGNDWFRGNSAANDLRGGNGNDTFQAWVGADLFDGEGGTDTVTFAGWNSHVTLNLELTTAQAGAGGITVLNIENVQGGNGNDTLRGNGAANALSGGNGNDTFLAWSGADVFDGEGGSDTVSFVGWNSNVTLNLELTTVQAGAGGIRVLSIEHAQGGNGDDFLRGNSAANNLSGGNGNDTFQAWSGADVFDGEGGSDTVTFAGWNSGVTLNLGLTTAQGGAFGLTVLNIENADGGNGNDTLTGSAADNGLFGGLGGNDTLNGGDGNDTFRAWSGADVFDGQGGTGDTVSFVGWNTSVTLNLELTGVQAGAGGIRVLNIENIQGGNGNDSLRGNNGVNVLNGGSGNDTFQAWVGADVFDGEGGSGDTVSFAGWNSHVTLDLGVTTAQAGAGNLTVLNIENVLGGNGNDTLTGSALANVLTGGAGKDTLTGAAAADTFAFLALTDSSLTAGLHDVITDFETGTDFIDLSALDAIAGGGNDAFTFLATEGAAFTAAGQLRFRQEGGNTFVDASTDADTDAEFTIELSGTKNLTSGDFIL